jgi:hypothetical protein
MTTTNSNRTTHQQRVLALIDAENLDSEHQRGTLTEGLGEAWRALIPPSPSVLCTAAADGDRLMALAREFPRDRHLIGRGTDGADRALLGSLDWSVLARFGCLVIGSGDHLFTEAAKRAQRIGLSVVVIARPEALARSLSAHADLILDFDFTVHATGRFATAA